MVYNMLCQELVTENLPWRDSDDFQHDWVPLYDGDPDFRTVVEVKIRRHPSLLSSLSNFLFTRPSNPVTARLQTLLDDLKSPSLSFSGNGLIDEDHYMDVDDHVPSSQTPTSTSPKSYPEESTFNDREISDMIGTLPDDEGSHSMDPSTSMLSRSVEVPLPVEDVHDKFSCAGLSTGVEEVKKHPLHHLSRKSRKGLIGHPKKEYFRCQHIRGLKKSIRQLREGSKKPPKSAIHRVINEVQMAKWIQLREYYKSNRSILDSISYTEVGPVTDGKKKKSDSKRSTDPKSYNNPYCTDFFSNPVVQWYNALYCDLVYGADPVEMCKKMKANCCEMAEHHFGCEGMWREVWMYARTGMLLELGLQVNVPEPEMPAVETYLAS